MFSSGVIPPFYTRTYTTASFLYEHVFAENYAAVHESSMAHDIPKLLQKMMDALPGNQTQIAGRLSTRGFKVPQPQVSRWLKGQEPDVKAYERIVEVAVEIGVLRDVRSEDVAHQIERKPAKTVRVKGYVGAGDEAHFYKVSDEDYEEVPAPNGSTEQTVAVEIRGTSWGPFMNAWLVFYDDVRSPVTEDLLGQPCVVGLADDRILIKVIRRDGNGGYRLVSNNTTEPDIEHADIEWAAKVTSMRPR
jgi:phage repressor protein C with HTH and peptisase S24 domain